MSERKKTDELRLTQYLERNLGASVKRLRQLGGGCIDNASAIYFSDGRKAFLKWSTRKLPGRYQAEAAGLTALAEARSCFVIPSLLLPPVDSLEQCPAFLLLELLEPGDSGPRAEERFGRALAELHRNHHTSYGWYRDNYLGLNPQYNTPGASSWAEFFLQQRLYPQLRLSEAAGWSGREFRSLFAAAEPEILKRLESAEEPPSLLHGDLWSGNIFWSNKGPALIDPAVYYGSREADLAFLELFGGLSRRMLAAYTESFPLLEGYERRKDVLNLYHLLNHANLFGGSYIRSSAEVLRSLI